MNLSRNFSWNPAGTANIGDIREAFDRLLGNPAEADQSNVVTSQWAPRVDIKEEDKRFVIYADIPGVDPEKIEVSMEKGILTIKGERTVENREQNGKFTRLERSHGVFYRRFALPDSADADGVTAHGKHGVLEIVIPKKAETTPRRITINTGS
ncbi:MULTISPECIES: Hsp20/alpha crystallin family protein [Rhodanobacter]|uniref:Hsp20/alpha crystallin family protein n=1 Tax=Rhodanobacter TaxID=75309 RepID=UPI0003FA9187|nr:MULTISPECIES: Hsp20/alpha crystallin family protein [Rhodanobacter]TAN16396.1 MAG: Hsp20/alpha crystallin family protein [Rhodanobacter sp.]UJJ53172.1 Hsp20/alpha crystallin family protein [Rhodanobacter thiooxydans]